MRKPARSKRVAVARHAAIVECGLLSEDRASHKCFRTRTRSANNLSRTPRSNACSLAVEITQLPHCFDSCSQSTCALSAQVILALGRRLCSVTVASLLWQSLFWFACVSTPTRCCKNVGDPPAHSQTSHCGACPLPPVCTQKKPWPPRSWQPHRLCTSMCA